MGIDYKLTIDSEKFKTHEGPKINYSDSKISPDEFFIHNHPLIFEQQIQKQNIDCFTVNNNKAFFKTKDGDFPFDILAASFYLISRYEEYLPHEKDMYGRYAHENSLAFKEGFLNMPLVNIWIKEFANALIKKFPHLQIKLPEFSFVPSYDIDIAWSYKSKGILRNLGGFIKTPSIERLSVLAGLQKDPFYSYDFLHQLHKKYDLKPVYFFLVATAQSIYDKNISPYNHRMWSLIKKHSGMYSIGLHPSWKSNESIDTLKREKKIIETASEITVTKSRQHYIKLSMPKTFEMLLQAGITDDYSMGYGSINGFRASIASSFPWYNLKTEKITPLKLHPFCFMDANSFYEQKQDADTSFEELAYYYETCLKTGGQFISIFHNNFLGTDTLYAGWKEMYEKFISQTQQ